MADVTLQARARTVTGKKVRRLRRLGLIPANIYGRGVASTAVELEAHALRDALATAGMSTVVNVHVTSSGGIEDGKSHPVLIEHVSRHPSSGHVLHVDLRQVDLNRPVRAAVPITLVGEAPAVKLGGVLVHPLDTIEVEALPRALPHAIEVDISGLAEIDAQLTVGDLLLAPGVTIDTDPETLVVRVVASRVEQEVAAEQEAAEAAQAAQAAQEPAEAESAEGAGERAEPEAGSRQ